MPWHALHVQGTSVTIKAHPLFLRSLLQALGYGAPNMRFVEGQIEDLKVAGIEDSSVDLVISNCVVG